MVVAPNHYDIHIKYYSNFLNALFAMSEAVVSSQKKQLAS